MGGSEEETVVTVKCTFLLAFRSPSTFVAPSLQWLSELRTDTGPGDNASGAPILQPIADPVLPSSKPQKGVEVPPCRRLFEHDFLSSA